MLTKKHIFFSIFLLCCIHFSYSQQLTPELQAQDIVQAEDYDPLKPARTAFYSAIFPGLGQISNKDYWKAPVVWGALGTGVYIAVDNHNEFQRYRDAFKDRLAGRRDEFTIEVENPEDGSITLVERISDDGLVNAQDTFRRNKELAILITAGMYVLQIIEANVDAHLSQFDVEDRISLNTSIELDQFTRQINYGLRLTYHID